MNDLARARHHVEQEWRRFIDRLATHPEAWAQPTRCEGWAIADLARHVVWGMSFEADAVARARAGVRMPAEGCEPAADAGIEAVLAQLDASCNQLVAQLDAAAAEGTTADLPMPYGDIPIGLAHRIFVIEAGVHGSDLASALGLGDTLSDAVSAAAMEVLNVFAPILAEGAGSQLPPGAVLVVRSDAGILRLGQRTDGGWTATADGPATAEISGPPSEVALFALGRRPLDGLTVTGDVDLARTYQQLIPGP